MKKYKVRFYRDCKECWEIEMEAESEVQVYDTFPLTSLQDAIFVGHKVIYQDEYVDNVEEIDDDY